MVSDSEPFFEPLQPAHLVECADLRLNQLQDAVRAEELRLGGPHPADVRAGEPSVAEGRLLDEILRLTEAHAAYRRSQGVPVGVVELDAELPCDQIIERSRDQAMQLCLARRLQVPRQRETL